MKLAIVAAALNATAASAQGYDSDGELWKLMSRDVSARCMIEVATATNEQHLLTQEVYRTATERKAVQLAGEAIRGARALDNAIYAHDRRMERQRDLRENNLITQAEYDAAAAEAPSIQPILATMRAYPACDFYRTAHGPSVRRARQMVGR